MRVLYKSNNCAKLRTHLSEMGLTIWLVMRNALRVLLPSLYRVRCFHVALYNSTSGTVANFFVFAHLFPVIFQFTRCRTGMCVTILSILEACLGSENHTPKWGPENWTSYLSLIHHLFLQIRPPVPGILRNWNSSCHCEPWKPEYIFLRSAIKNMLLLFSLSCCGKTPNIFRSSWIVGQKTQLQKGMWTQKRVILQIGWFQLIEEA